MSDSEENSSKSESVDDTEDTSRRNKDRSSRDKNDFSMHHRLSYSKKRNYTMKYKEAQEKISGVQESNDILKGTATLSETLDVTEKLYRKGGQKDCAILDAQCMISTSNATKHLVQSLHTDSKRFDVADFADKLRTRLNPTLRMRHARESAEITKGDWVEFGKVFGHIQKITPPFEFMYGSFEVAPLQPKQRQQPRARISTKDIHAKAVQPKQIDPKTQLGDDTTPHEVEHINDQIERLYVKNGRETLPFIQVVVDPTSFSRTVENIFHTSFLAKDGYLTIDREDDSGIVIKPSGKNDQNRSRKEINRANNNQSCLSFTRDQWKKWVEAFEITRPALKKPKKNK